MVQPTVSLDCPTDCQLPRSALDSDDLVLTLTELRITDAVALTTQTSPEFYASTPTFPNPFTVEHATAYISSKHRTDLKARWVTGSRDACGGTEEDWEIAFWIHAKWFGRGVMSRAMDVALKYAWDQGVERIFGGCFVWNAASIRTMDKAGFKQSARLEAVYTTKEGVAMDAFFYTRLRDGKDCEAPAKASCVAPPARKEEASLLTPA
ncbi:hypothetical protein HKX48_003299 [Thoreauomyces humboldtii]|nr:hypothetical protein HKX48_003299 [Thoreauomyces humboldtii]